MDDFKSQWKSLDRRERQRLWRLAAAGETDPDPAHAALIAGLSRSTLARWWAIPFGLAVAGAVGTVVALLLDRLIGTDDPNLVVVVPVLLVLLAFQMRQRRNLRNALAKSEEVLRHQHQPRETG